MAFAPGAIEAVERAGRHVAVELRAIGGQRGAETIEHFDRQAARDSSRVLTMMGGTAPISTALETRPPPVLRAT